MPEIRLYNEDCIAAMKKVEDKSISLIVTDPPYNLGNFMKNRDTNLSKMRDNFFGSAGWDDMEFDEWEKSMDDFFKAAAKVMRKGGTMIVMQFSQFHELLPDYNLQLLDFHLCLKYFLESFHEYIHELNMDKLL